MKGWGEPGEGRADLFAAVGAGEAEAGIELNVMTRIRVHDKNFEPYLSAERIAEKIREVAAQLNRDYANKRPLFIAILNGAFMFASDLFKEITIDAEISFI